MNTPCPRTRLPYVAAMVALSNLHAASLFFQPDAEAGDPLALEVVADVAVLIDRLAAKGRPDSAG